MNIDQSEIDPELISGSPDIVEESNLSGDENADDLELTAISANLKVLNIEHSCLLPDYPQSHPYGHAYVIRTNIQDQGVVQSRLLSVNLNPT
jgi:hypothetical protein